MQTRKHDHNTYGDNGHKGLMHFVPYALATKQLFKSMLVANNAEDTTNLAMAFAMPSMILTSLVEE